MAKMKLMEVLNKLLAGKLDEEIDIDLGDEPKDYKSEHDKKDESTKDDKSEVDKVNNEEEKDKVNTSKKTTNKVEKDEKAEVNKMDDIKMFEDGWFDEESGNVDLESLTLSFSFKLYTSNLFTSSRVLSPIILPEKSGFCAEE